MRSVTHSLHFLLILRFYSVLFQLTALSARFTRQLLKFDALCALHKTPGSVLAPASVFCAVKSRFFKSYPINKTTAGLRRCRVFAGLKPAVVLAHGSVLIMR